MSTTNSIANFYVDSEGHEQPIKYKSAALVNTLAPEGYHWERRNDEEEKQKTLQPGDWIYPNRLEVQFDYYICVKDKETN
jgi:hypothetical protein